MSPENKSPEGKLTISYNPNDMIDLLESNGYITTHFLMRQLECGDTEAFWIISDLTRLQVVSSSDDDWIVNKERMVAEKAYRLTETGRQKTGSFNQRKVELIAMPSLARMSMETVNDVLDAANATGLRVDDLAELARTNDQRFTDLVKQRKLAVLGEFSSNDLQQLASELKLIKRHPPSD